MFLPVRLPSATSYWYGQLVRRVSDAHDRQFIDYSMMDNSRTGKAGEADIIIGIGKTGTSEEENTVRHICISKNIS
jgi:hypothetical protein